ncbi:MAG: acyl-CoA dehydrogenase [Legionellales bacterium]|nr:acyl-CoA dehydrogenase [Legionellales bacterium]
MYLKQAGITTSASWVKQHLPHFNACVSIFAMDFFTQLNDDSKLLAETIKQFCVSELMLIDSQTTLDPVSFKRLWQAMGQMGLHAITLSSDDGGLGLTEKDHAIAMLLISYYSASIGLSYAAHSNLCMTQIARICTPSQKARWLPKLITGEHIGALAISEPNSGSDAKSMRLMAEKVSGGYLLTGEKMWITNGPIADIIIVYARTSSCRNGLTTFIIEAPTPGLIQGKPISKMGMTLSPTGSLVFNRCFVPDVNRVGELGDGADHLLLGLDYERLLLAAGPLGIQSACLDLIQHYSMTRQQFGRPIAKYQLIQSKIADIYTRFHAGLSYLLHACDQAQTGQLTQAMAASTILLTSEHATQAALEAIQVLGGNGYSTEYPAERYLRDAKLYEIGAGTNEIRRIIIAKALTKTQ